jgi:hypothetical protein
VNGAPEQKSLDVIKSETRLNYTDICDILTSEWDLDDQIGPAIKNVLETGVSLGAEDVCDLVMAEEKLLSENGLGNWSNLNVTIRKMCAKESSIENGLKLRQKELEGRKKYFLTDGVIEEVLCRIEQQCKEQ